MPQADQSVEPLADAETYFQVQHFYATQLRHLDSGDAEAWAATFTADAVFATNTMPKPIQGRTAIAAAVRRGARRRAETGVVQRHWVGMLVAGRRADGAIVARSYSLVTSTPPGGPATLALTTVVDDVLVREDGTWLTAERLVSHDDVPPVDGPPAGVPESAAVPATAGP
jgi:uncharacterized protein (TIGR02246 family)